MIRVLVFLSGGARSGKSSIAVKAAAKQQTPVTVIATATAGDSEMAQRIAQHQGERPRHWALIEEPVDLLGAAASVNGDHTIIVDALRYGPTTGSSTKQNRFWVKPHCSPICWPNAAHVPMW